MSEEWAIIELYNRFLRLKTPQKDTWMVKEIQWCANKKVQNTIFVTDTTTQSHIWDNRWKHAQRLNIEINADFTQKDNKVLECKMQFKREQWNSVRWVVHENPAS